LNLKTIFEALEWSFEALETIFEVEFVFFIVFRLGWPEMKNVAGDGECRRWRGEGKLEKKKKKKKKKKETSRCVREVGRRRKKKKIRCFVLILFFLK
jgi:hypothetical protein